MTDNLKISAILFSAILWGAAEILIGDLVHVYSLPVRGIILTSLSVFFIIAARMISKFSGSTLILGILVSLFKAVYYGTFTHSAIYAVLLQTVLAEIIFFIVKKGEYQSVAIAVILMVYTFVHGIIMHGVFFGTHIYSAYKNLLREIELFSPLSDSSIEIVISFFLLAHIIIGILVGITTNIIAKKNKILIEYFFD